MTVLPPIASPDDLWADLARLPPPEPGDATHELADIVVALTPSPNFTLPDPPDGMMWEGEIPGWSSGTATLVPSDALQGPWEPASRPHLRAVIEHLELPTARASITKLRELRGYPFRTHIAFWGPPPPEACPSLPEIRQLAKALVVDARYQHAHRGDVEAAWEDLKTASWVADGVVAPDVLISLLVRRAIEELWLAELRHLARECALPDALVKDMHRVLCEAPPDRDLWASAIEAEHRANRDIIDASFSRTADGNGWLVLSQQEAVLDQLGYTASAGAPRSRLWDLASIFYNDRRTAEQKLDAQIEPLLRAFDGDYSQLLELTSGKHVMNVLDGRVLNLGYFDLRGAAQMLWGQPMRRQATRAVLALNQYKARHGSYPTTLADLVPEFIESVPADVFGEGPLRYERTCADAYLLYSIGVDDEDDGGERNKAGEVGDFVFSEPRGEPDYEPKLVPAPEEDEAGGFLR